jgi:hypothetical protein
LGILYNTWELYTVPNFVLWNIREHLAASSITELLDYRGRGGLWNENSFSDKNVLCGTFSGMLLPDDKSIFMTGSVSVRR